MEILNLTDLEQDHKTQIIRHVRKLCEYLPNLVLSEPSLVIESEPLHLTVAIILEARRKCKLTPIWPEELDLMIFGPKIN